ncbi:MAG: nitrate reductase cytochrome c-type subunit [Verrucomicrobiales bacterium]|nr:nitrate reductase cytochrome c-type subunit [Verrucomicrobiales bacterium]
MDDQPPSAAPRGIQISFMIGSIFMLTAVSGYFVGLRQTNSAIAITQAVEVVKAETHRDLTGTAAVPTAVRYIDQDWSAHGPNAFWRTSLLDFVQNPAAVPNQPVSAEIKMAALQARAGRRAYDGAPPTVPHPVTQDSSAACLACHDEGLQVKDRFASKISHAHFGGSCTQCHVSTRGAFPAADAARYDVPLADNSFQGSAAPTSGPRAWPGAPPTIPHATLMRSDCLSCHGPHGLFALRTPHPERHNCKQCHAAAAAKDQRQFLTTPPLDAPRPVPPPVATPVPAAAAPPAQPSPAAETPPNPNP